MTERFNLCVLDGGTHAWVHAPIEGLLHDAAFDNCGLHERLGGKERVDERIEELRAKARAACEHQPRELFIDHFQRLLICALYCGGPCRKGDDAA